MTFCHIGGKSAKYTNSISYDNNYYAKCPFTLSKATNLGEGKLWIQTSSTFKNLPHCTLFMVEELGKFYWRHT